MRKIAPRAHTLVIDIGGTNIKIRLSGRRTVLKIPSGPTLTPSAMVRLVRQAVEGWTFSRVSIGYPGVVRRGKPVMEPKNLGRGWVRFDFTRAFACPVKVINDAAMQALVFKQSEQYLDIRVRDHAGRGIHRLHADHDFQRPADLDNEYRQHTYAQRQF